ncbi:MAG: hypothetical protein RJB38_949 [Pseudomonadota bacterium]|jgi:hypothetical protein
MPHKNPHRRFLHDLATPMAVMKILSKKLLSELEASGSGADFSKQIERARKICEQVDKMEALHADQKAFLSELERRKAA